MELNKKHLAEELSLAELPEVRYLAGIKIQELMTVNK